MMKNFVTIFTGVVVAGVVITFSAFSMRAEADQRQQIYDEAVAIREQREANLIKAYEPYRLEAEKERSLVEKAKADAEKAKAKADETFEKAIREHPIPEDFMDTEASEESNLLNCSYEYELEQKLKEEETSEEEPLYDEVASTAALLLTPEEEDFLLRVFYAESGDYNSDKFLEANAWMLRNGIEKYGFWKALTPEHYQVIGYDGIVRGAEGIVTSEMAHENERITSIFYGVMSGKIESPIANYTCGLPYDVWEYESGYEFACDHGIAECSVIDNGCYFPAECWTEALTELLNNTPA